MSENGLEQCSVCSRLLSTRYGGACPRCRASLGVGAVAPPRGAREVPDEWPRMECVFTETHKVRPKVPAGAKAIWAECLTHALKHVAFYNDEKSWTQLFALPKMVLGAPSSRGGANKKKGGPTREVTENAASGSRGSARRCGQKRPSRASPEGRPRPSRRSWSSGQRPTRAKACSARPRAYSKANAPLRWTRSPRLT